MDGNQRNEPGRKVIKIFMLNSAKHDNETTHTCKYMLNSAEHDNETTHTCKY